MSPLFSIVTVTLNAGELLRPTVDSVLAQTGADYEHIVKDGGSTDGSTAFLQALGYAAAGPRQLRVCADGGIYDAMNQALRTATGTYVHFLNAGDLFCGPNGLAALAAAVPAGWDGSLVYTDYNAGRGNQLVCNPDRLSPFFLYRTTLNHQCCFFRRTALLEAGGFDTSYRVLADYECLVRLLANRRTSARHIPLNLVHYRAGGFSEDPGGAGERRRELRRLRRRHFPAVQRLLFATAWGLTLPGLRRAALRHRHVDVFYSRLRNRLYRRHAP
jgi:glycosyltransferase involved in cell wall biosynthesis